MDELLCTLAHVHILLDRIYRYPSAKASFNVCQQSFDNLAICFAIYASFLILFSKFFNTAYLVKKGKTAAAPAVKPAEKTD
ncbi:unnamed protein product [Nippostrongylus brasiliensis]|uniref:Elongation of very long chain fatty acids protein n=1 Tax=Nippostrongylus brasiliensis TaxID=27835 RepID=A0A0N4XXR9_NIPBR|nr:unnamed protein product [Nippostrongylus brasiliensis]